MEGVGLAGLRVGEMWCPVVRSASVASRKSLEGRKHEPADRRSALRSAVPNRRRDVMRLLKTFVAAGTLAAVSAMPALAIDISGAGATFPYPLYAKWADAHKKETGSGLEYQRIGSGGGIKKIKAKNATFGRP